jgi:hypothetical protein
MIEKVFIEITRRVPDGAPRKLPCRPGMPLNVFLGYR